MKPNLEALCELVNESFRGNKSAFANAIGVERSQVSQILNNGTGAGSQFFGGVISYCERNNLNFKDYIFLPQRK